MKKFLILIIIVTAPIFFFTDCNIKTGNANEKGNSASLAAGMSGLIKSNKEAESIEHGKYLAWHVAGCMDCHSQRDLKKFSGPVIPGTEGMGGERFGPEFGLPGNVFAKNITPAGIGNWTDEELIRAMTRGINKNGDTLFPLMPYLSYSQMPKQDILDIVKYIRTLKPIENKIPERKLFIPIAMAIPPQLPSPDLDKNTKPDPSDAVKYGAYLVEMASCSDCHTPRVQGRPDFSKLLAGGNSFTTEHFKVISANITPDQTGGIGTWTEKMFLQKFRINSSEEYVNRDPGKNNSIMPWSLYGKMKEGDLKAIYAYLRTVKPYTVKIAPWGSGS
jgi:mono/diheme cytochrome c family protein